VSGAMHLRPRLKSRDFSIRHPHMPIASATREKSRLSRSVYASSRRHVAQAPDLRRPSVGRVAGVFGKWFITSVDVGPVSAIDEKSAQLLIGKTAYFDAKFVQLGEH
jgi:hypothetical protein